MAMNTYAARTGYDRLRCHESSQCADRQSAWCSLPSPPYHSFSISCVLGTAQDGTMVREAAISDLHLSSLLDDQEGAQIGDDCGKHHRSGGHALTAQKCLPLSTRQIRSWRRSLRPPRARRRGLPWRCSRRCCLQRCTIFPTWRWPRRSRTGRASAAFRLCPR